MSDLRQPVPKVITLYLNVIQSLRIRTADLKRYRKTYDKIYLNFGRMSSSRKENAKETLY